MLSVFQEMQRTVSQQQYSLDKAYWVIDWDIHNTLCDENSNFPHFLRGKKPSIEGIPFVVTDTLMDSTEACPIVLIVNNHLGYMYQNNAIYTLAWNTQVFQDALAAIRGVG